MNLKKLLSVILAITVLCSLFGTFTALAATEYVTGDLTYNGNLELLGSTFHGWAGSDEGTNRVSTTLTHGGDRSIKLAASNGSKMAIYQSIFGVIPGEKYKFSAYLYIKELLTFSDNVGGSMEIEFYEADGLTRTGNSVFKCFPGEKEQWTLCSFEGVAPKNAGCAFIHLYLDCGGEIYFDDVSFVGKVTKEDYEAIKAQNELGIRSWEHSQELVKLEQEQFENTQFAPGSANTVLNPSFEELDADGNPVHYQGFKKEWSSITHITDEEARTGKYSGKITTDDPSVRLPYIMQQLTGDLVAGSEYMLSAWVKPKGMAALQGAMLKVETYSSSETSAATYTGSGETGTLLVEDGVWQEVKLVFTLPENTNTIIFYIRMTGTGTLYYDDISFGPTGSSSVMNFYTKDVFYYTEDGKLEAFADIDYINHPIANGSTVDFVIKDGETVIASQTVPASASAKAEFDIMTLAEKTKKYTISAVYKTADGTIIEESAPKRIYRYDRPTMLDENGRFIVDGKPLDVMMLYGSYVQYYDDYVKAGITVVRPDDVRYSVVNNIPEIRKNLDAAHEKGLKVLYQLYGRPAGHPFQIPTTKRLVEEFKDHPALLAWMMIDEPCKQVGTGTYTEVLEYLEEGYKVIRDIDPHHPVYTLECAGLPTSLEQSLQYVDIAAVDPYPLEATQTYHPYNITKRTVDAVFNEKDVWALGYASDRYLPWDAGAIEYRMNLYTMVWAGAEGLGFYTNHNKTPLLMDTLTKMNESGELHQVYDHFVNKNSQVFNEYLGNDYWMRSWVDEGNLYVLVKEHKNDGTDTPVNFNLKSANGLIEINGFEAQLVNGPTAETVTSADSTFSLTLKPLEIGMYKIALDDSVDLSLLDEPMYSDLAGFEWAADAIEKITSMGIANNEGTGIYSPGKAITRGDFAGYLIRTLGLSADVTDQFADVDASSPYAKEIAIGKALGILKGTGNNIFEPNAPISRQDLMVICARGLRSLNRIASADAASVLASFSDIGLISDYALSDVAAMVASRTITGNPDLTINPLGNTTRAEAAVIMSRMLAY